MASEYESVVAFLSGVDKSDRIAATAFRTWVGGSNPADYNQTYSTAAKWGDTEPGTPGAVTYWFDGGSEWSPGEQGAFEACMALWAAVADVTITKAASADAANFLIVRGRGASWTPGSPTPVEIGGDRLTTPPALTESEEKLRITYQPSSYGNLGPDLGSKANGAYSTLIHELGHMLGLGHAGPYNSDNVPSQQFSPYDMTLWSIMSYFEPHEAGRYTESYPVKNTNWGTDSSIDKHYEPLTPMMLDILAIQRLYGAATSGPLTGGGHIFGFNSNIEGPVGRFYNFDVNRNPIVTIWENGRGNTLDLSKFSQDAVIDLNPGTFSSAGGKTNNIGIAFGTVIEKGIGGSGDDKITASDMASTLDGRAGNDVLWGGAGIDVLTGGDDPDTLHPGGGLNVLRDTLEHMDGDTVFEFGQSTTISVTGSLIGRSHLRISEFDGDTTLILGDTEILLEGIYRGGDFMAAARAADGLHTEIAFKPFLPALSEGVSVAPQAINGIVNQPFLAGDGLVQFSVTLTGAISAFNNTVGWYKVGSDGTISGVDILFANTRSPGATTVTLGAPASGEKIGFFLIQDGFGQFGALPDNLSFLNQGSLTPGNADGGLPLVLQSATLGILDATVFHSIQGLNPGHANQVLSGTAPGGRVLQVGFEDLPTATGDNDFQDVLLSIFASRDDVFFV